MGMENPRQIGPLIFGFGPRKDEKGGPEPNAHNSYSHYCRGGNIIVAPALSEYSQPKLFGAMYSYSVVPLGRRLQDFGVWQYLELLDSSVVVHAL